MSQVAVLAYWPLKTGSHSVCLVFLLSSLWTPAIKNLIFTRCRSQWPCGLRRRSSAAHLLRSWVRIPPGTRMFVCSECFVLWSRGLCVRLITRPEESYRLWRVVVCDQETSKTRRLKAATGLWKIQPKWVVTTGKQTNKHLYSLLVHISWLIMRSSG